MRDATPGISVRPESSTYLNIDELRAERVDKDRKLDVRAIKTKDCGRVRGGHVSEEKGFLRMHLRGRLDPSLGRTRKPQETWNVWVCLLMYVARNSVEKTARVLAYHPAKVTTVTKVTRWETTVHNVQTWAAEVVVVSMALPPVVPIASAVS